MMLWYNNPDSVEAIRRARLEDRTTTQRPRLRVARTDGDITEMSH